MHSRLGCYKNQSNIAHLYWLILGYLPMGRFVYDDVREGEFDLGDAVFVLRPEYYLCEFILASTK